MTTEIPGLTIDDARTRDIDDAIAVERLGDGWRVIVSIADVGSKVVLDTDLDRKARDRIATRYFGSGNSPMLPRFLAERNLSLWPGERRSVMVLDLTLDQEFETRKFTVYRGTFRSQAKLTYEEVPAILGNPKHCYHSLLSDAKIVSFGMLAKRRKKGAMALYDLNNGWVTTEEGFFKKLENKDAVVGHIIIQELMIRVNAEVAQFGASHGLPLLYRNHNARQVGPELEALAKVILEGLDHPIVGLDELRKSTHHLLEKATYGSVLSGHFGLGLPAYLHFTSPIRRYADLVNHRQIKAMIQGEAHPYSVEQIEEIAVHIQTKTLAEQQQRSDAEKQKAEARSLQALDDRQIDGLHTKSFERLVKTMARSGEDAPESFIEGFEHRLRNGNVPLLCMTVIFGEAPELPGWARVKEWIIQRMIPRAEDAVSIFAQGIPVVGWPAVEYETKDHGPPHERVFVVTARLAESQSQATAKTSKEAKQRAALKLLALIGRVPLPSFEEPVVTSALPLSAVTAPPAETENPIGALQEFCQKRGLDLPVYAFKHAGPAHMPVIACTCKLSKIERTAVASSKKEAKQRVAQEMLASLGTTTNFL